MDDETDWRKQLLVGLGVLVVVGALIGGIVALVSIKAADYAGIGGSTATSGPATKAWSPPTDAESPSATEGTEPETSEEPPESPTSQPPERPRNKGITLTAQPKAVSSYGRINLTGTFAGGAGTTLQVQRMESGQWVDFPTSATVNGGAFATYIETGRPGPNKFRVKAVGGSKTSNTVTVRVS